MGSLVTAPVRVLGRYALHGEIAHGGMATIHFGRLLGVVGFSKTVAIKRLHPQFAKDPEFVSMFLDEARLAARIRHPNVVSTLDVVALEGELFLVMEYVLGESLLSLVRAAVKQGTRVPPEIVASIMAGALHGLHAAHEAKSERGEPLGIVHRDVSPQNILVGSDGVTRVLDFGVAKAAGRAQTTREGQIKGKLAYMSPEQLHGSVTRATDVWAAAAVLWEALVGRRLFAGASEGETVKRVLDQPIEAPSQFVPGLPRALDVVTLRGLCRDPEGRYATARDMAKELERALAPAPTSDVGEFVEHMAGPALADRAGRMAEIESSSSDARAVAAAAVSPTDATRTDVDLTMPMPPVPDRHVESSAVVATVTDSQGRPSLDAEAIAVRRRAIRRIVTGAVGVSGALILVAVGVALGSKRSSSEVGNPAAAAAVSQTPAVTSAEAPGIEQLPPPAPPPDPANVPTADIASATATASATASVPVSAMPPMPPPAIPRPRSRPAAAPRSPGNPLDGVLDSRK
jgi:eukaryotic-like serine/threonine-protein kinase